MKTGHLLVLCSVIALPQMAMADLASTNPAGLGDVHALLSYCADADPADADSFKAQWKSIVSGASEKALDGVEDGAAFKASYDTLKHILEKLPRPEVVSICRTTAMAWDGGKGRATGDR